MNHCVYTTNFGRFILYIITTFPQLFHCCFDKNMVWPRSRLASRQQPRNNLYKCNMWSWSHRCDSRYVSFIFWQQENRIKSIKQRNPCWGSWQLCSWHTSRRDAFTHYWPCLLSNNWCACDIQCLQPHRDIFCSGRMSTKEHYLLLPYICEYM